MRENRERGADRAGKPGETHGSRRDTVGRRFSGSNRVRFFGPILGGPCRNSPEIEGNCCRFSRCAGGGAPPCPFRFCSECAVIGLDLGFRRDYSGSRRGCQDGVESLKRHLITRIRASASCPCPIALCDVVDCLLVWMLQPIPLRSIIASAGDRNWRSCYDTSMRMCGSMK